MAASRQLSVRVRLQLADRSEPLFDKVLADKAIRALRIGGQAWLLLLDVPTPPSLPTDTRISYDIGLSEAAGARELWIKDWAPHLCLPGHGQPAFAFKSRLDRILHGSCRRPHDPAADGLVRVDEELQKAWNDPKALPALLMMSGDQVYADDVAGPVLRAIHALIARLGLYDETIPGSSLNDSRELYGDARTYYHRDRLLPATRSNQPLIARFFGGARKPVFTTANARNHLITLAEVLAMYLLVWSPVCWRLIKTEPPALGDAESRRYSQEQGHVDRFVANLPRAARALAHLPTYMIFDDHDITDDWNLSAEWEATVYDHPFSRRIVGNALIGYLLCQGWGNRPSAFEEIIPVVSGLLLSPGQDGLMDSAMQDALIDSLLAFRQWHYSLQSSPPLLVLDTRTRRWRNEGAPHKPSGLMDRESLAELEQSLQGEQSVIVVSPTPMFGVKLIEVIQRIFTFFGRPLMVDAENWMAHSHTPNILLDIFGHPGTPQHFVILSGDVHYSFVYDVRIRHRQEGPRIWQITSSGIKSEFPKRLLEWLDRMNRWLYTPWSPLNLFTKRRGMWISPRLPTGREAGERLWNNAGVGLVDLDEQGAPDDIRQLNAVTGGTRFLQDENFL